MQKVSEGLFSKGFFSIRAYETLLKADPQLSHFSVNGDLELTAALPKLQLNAEMVVSF